MTNRNDRIAKSVTLTVRDDGFVYFFFGVIHGFFVVKVFYERVAVDDLDVVSLQETLRRGLDRSGAVQVSSPQELKNHGSDEHLSLAGCRTWTSFNRRACSFYVQVLGDGGVRLLQDVPQSRGHTSVVIEVASLGDLREVAERILTLSTPPG